MNNEHNRCDREEGGHGAGWLGVQAVELLTDCFCL